MMRPLPITGPRLNSAAMSVPYYITTAINYPNGRPHIGHAYEAIAADAIARFQRQAGRDVRRSEEHTSELQSLMRISYAVFCLKKKKHRTTRKYTHNHNDSI